MYISLLKKHIQYVWWHLFPYVIDCLLISETVFERLMTHQWCLNISDELVKIKISFRLNCFLRFCFLTS